jgi:hypothetical protein
MRPNVVMQDVPSPASVVKHLLTAIVGFPLFAG